MTLAAPLFLAAALAAAIPVVLHMINRNKAKDLPFATLRFLRISAQKTRRRKHIHDVLLMLLRAAVLVLIAVALSKPAMTNLRSLFGGANSAIAIVLDNSASMGAIDNNRLRFDTALAAANQIIEQLRDGDQVALFLTGGKAAAELGKLDRKHETVRQAVAQLRQASFERGDVAARVLEARKALADSELTNRLIFVISDFQAGGWDSLRQRRESDSKAGEEKSAQQQKEEAIPLVIVDVQRGPKPNVAVRGVALEAAVPVAGLPITAAAEVFNAASVPQQRLVELYIDGVKEAGSPVLNIPAESTLRHDFVFGFKTGGLHRGEVRLVGEDGSKLDDRFFFTMEVDQGIPVAVVKPAAHEVAYLEDTFYVERALGQGRKGNWALRLTSLAFDQLAGEPLSNYKILYCVNLPAADDALAEKLRSYVEQGGNIVWMCGDNVDPAAYNQMNVRARNALLPLPLLDVRAPAPGEDRESWQIGFLDKRHRAMAHLVEPPSLYQSVLVYKFVRMDASKAGDAAILARLDDGEPLLAQRKVERGSVTLLGTSGHVNWTNLPVRPIFLPFIARMTFELSGAEQARYQGVAGAPLVLQFDNQIRPAGVEIVSPTGETLRLPVKEEAGQGPSFRYADTQAVGVYMLRLLQAVTQKQIAYAVNVDPEEADPAKIKEDELRELFPPNTLEWAEDPEALGPVFERLRQGKSLWGIFLTAVLVVLVFETFVSNQLSPKTEVEDPRLAKLPPGMRRLAKQAQKGGKPATGVDSPAAAPATT